jgi:hypothetical protein
MLGGVFVFRIIAAADVPTDQAKPQMNPGIAHLQAFLAALAAGFDLSNFTEMFAARCCGHGIPLPAENRTPVRGVCQALRLYSRLLMFE